MTGKRFFWVDCRGGENWNARKSIVTTALESGAAGIVLLPGDIEKARGLGSIEIISNSDDSDILLVGVGGEGDGTIDD